MSINTENTVDTFSSFLVNKTISLSTEDGSEHYIYFNVFNPIDLTYTMHTVTVEYNGNYNYMGDGSELVIDIENGKVYVDDIECVVNDLDGLFTEWDNITGITIY